MAANGVHKPECHFCDSEHSIDNMTRNKVILTSSSLSGVQYLEGWGWDSSPPLHVDLECIPGANITTLRRAWERAYHSNPLPIDTVLVAGLSDLKGLITEYASKLTEEHFADVISTEILASIKMLHNTVSRHSESFGVNDTIAVAPLMYVPSLYWHKDDGIFPTESYRNFATVIDKTNLKIEAYNVEYGITAAPSFLKRAGERGLKNGRQIYRWDAWKEDKKEEMMNLKDTFQIAITKKLATYFSKATPKSIEIVPN